MPELPEVEVLRRSLEPVLIGERFAGVRVRCAALREHVDGRRLRRLMDGRSIERLDRRAKYLLVEVERGATLAIHLGMSGRLSLVSPRQPLHKHEHVILGLASGRQLRFRDPRRFGLVFALPSRFLAEDRHFAHLGAEPLESGFDGLFLERAAGRRRAPVKSFLMDARVVVGVGNIYASEALWMAGIHPRRSVARISLRRWQDLADAVRRVLRRAIRQGGTTLNDFVDGDGNPGYFQVSLSAYGRAGDDCSRCGRPIRRFVQSGRSTFYCPGCQH